MLKLLAGPFVFFLATVGPGAAPDSGLCSDECDRKAAACVDACEAAHKDAKPRIECKLKCISEREKCEKSCP